MKDSVTNDEKLIAAEEAEVESDGGAESVAAGADPGETDAPEVEASAEGEASEEVANLRTDFQDLTDRHLRLVAEFNNFRRRSEQERLGAWGRAQADVIAKFLDVLDDLNRVAQLDLSNATVEAIMEGVDLVERKFIRMLEDTGVEVIDPSEGEPFDPERMEAVMRVVAESEEQDDSVAQVVQKGYALERTLVRPARVAVYKHG
ncbi:MAG TPA: nucleotide exchange factor GrpE [Longimicrobiales bacterium]|nr:nucleotide exchange factor GrpE [Longimicrobiales bacterium]